MAAKRILITGATSGIGREAASQLGRQGAALVLAVRDAAKGEAGATEIARETGGARPDVVLCDTSSQKSIRACAAEVGRRFDRLDVLINNAGTQRLTRAVTPEGMEEVFATNVLAYVLLTQKLLPLLKASAPARIVNVASTYAGMLDIDDLEFVKRPWNNIEAYKQSKQANRMLTWALVRRLQGTGVTANAMSPGLVNTGLYRDLTGFRRVFMTVLTMAFGRSVQKGADTVMWLAASPEVEGITGKFFVDRKDTPCQFRNEGNEERLWTICEASLAKSAPV